MPPATLIEDVLGTDPDDYARGRGRPPVSLREAVNALLRGELMTTPDTAVDDRPGFNRSGRKAVVSDGAGGLVAFWVSERSGVQQIYAARLALDHADAGFGVPLQITSGDFHQQPHAGDRDPRRRGERPASCAHRRQGDRLLPQR